MEISVSPVSWLDDPDYTIKQVFPVGEIVSVQSDQPFVLIVWNRGATRAHISMHPAPDRLPWVRTIESGGCHYFSFPHPIPFKVEQGIVVGCAVHIPSEEPHVFDAFAKQWEVPL